VSESENVGIGRVLREEAAELLGRARMWPGLMLYLFLFAALGALAPWSLGFRFLSQAVVVTYASLSPLFVNTVIVESLAGARAREGLARRSQAGAGRPVLIGKALVATLYGTASALLLLGVGLGVMNWRHWHGSPLLPPTATLASVCALSISLAFFWAGLGALVSLRAASARSAQRTLRLGFLLTMAGLLLAARVLPASWHEFWVVLFTTDALAIHMTWLAPVLVLGGLGLLHLAYARLPAPLNSHADR